MTFAKAFTPCWRQFLCVNEWAENYQHFAECHGSPGMVLIVHAEADFVPQNDYG